MIRTMMVIRPRSSFDSMRMNSMPTLGYITTTSEPMTRQLTLHA